MSCWQYVIVARAAPRAVVLRRGPSEWWHLTLWETDRDRFTSGQWFRGKLYPAKCDLSPDGLLFSYFAGKFRTIDVSHGYDRTWIAVSRPPYFTALALWPVGDTWGGPTVFHDDGSFYPETSYATHPNHREGPLRIGGFQVGPEEARVRRYHWGRNGWQPVYLDSPAKRLTAFDPLLKAWRKAEGRYCLERQLPRGEDVFPSRVRAHYVIYKGDGETELASFRAHWADFDQSGRLVATKDGRILAADIHRHHGLRWIELADFSAEKPVTFAAPDWAQHW